MLEFIALAGAMPDTRDYWAQVIDDAGAPQSEAIQFHFPRGATIWITATLTKVSTESPATLEQAAIAAAQEFKWMPINSAGALYRFAQQQKLGYPQTDEFELTFNNVVYVAQVYNLGIVYVKKGDWGNCQWVKKP